MCRYFGLDYVIRRPQGRRSGAGTADRMGEEAKRGWVHVENGTGELDGIELRTGPESWALASRANKRVARGFCL